MEKKPIQTPSKTNFCLKRDKVFPSFLLFLLCLGGRGEGKEETRLLVKTVQCFPVPLFSYQISFFKYLHNNFPTKCEFSQKMLV